MKNEQKMVKSGECGEFAKNNIHHEKRGSKVSKTAVFEKMVNDELMLPKVFMMKIVLKTLRNTLWKTLLELNSPHSPQYFVISLKRG